jgi:hypothetical protein
MRAHWRTAAIVLTGLFLNPGEGPAQEIAPPVPPWGQALEANAPAEEGRPHFLFAEEIDHWNEANFWVRPEYVLSWIRSSTLPPLVSTGLTTDKSPGAIGLPFTKILYGDGPLDFKDRHGFRITVGAALPRAEGELAIEGSYLTLGGRDQRFQSASPGSPVLARPFFDVIRNAEDSSLTAYPGFLSGSINVTSSSYLQSEELNVIESFWKCENRRFRALIGLRHVGLHEGLDIQEAATVTAAGPLLGQSVNVRDLFRTTNNFYGGQLGISADLRWRRFTTELFAKAAVGDLQQRVSINGSTAFQGTTFGGGLLAQSSNIGSYVRDQFSVVPEGGVKVQGAIGRHVLMHVGYSFLYLGNVVRPSYHVDRGVNPNLVPTSATFGAGGDPARPAFHFQESNYWAQLFSFGLTIQY